MLVLTHLCFSRERAASVQPNAYVSQLEALVGQHRNDSAEGMFPSPRVVDRPAQELDHSQSHLTHLRISCAPTPSVAVYPVCISRMRLFGTPRQSASLSMQATMAGVGCATRLWNTAGLTSTTRQPVSALNREWISSPVMARGTLSIGNSIANSWR